MVRKKSHVVFTNELCAHTCPVVQCTVMQNACFMLQVVMSFMECLERCLGHMMQLSLTDELCISHMHSLPSAVIQTVMVAFKHCKVHDFLHVHLN